MSESEEKQVNNSSYGERLMSKRSAIDEAQKNADAQGWFMRGVDSLIDNSIFDDFRDSPAEELYRAKEGFYNEAKMISAENGLFAEEQQKQLNEKRLRRADQEYLMGEKDLQRADNEIESGKLQNYSQRINNMNRELQFIDNVEKGSQAQIYNGLVANESFNALTPDEQKYILGSEAFQQNVWTDNAVQLIMSGSRNGNKAVVDKGIEYASMAGIQLQEKNGNYYMLEKDKEGKDVWSEVTPEKAGQIRSGLQARIGQEVEIRKKMSEANKSLSGRAHNAVTETFMDLQKSSGGYVDGPKAIQSAGQFMGQKDEYGKMRYTPQNQNTFIINNSIKKMMSDNNVTPEELVELKGIVEHNGGAVKQTENGFLVSPKNDGKYITQEEYIKCIDYQDVIGAQLNNLREAAKINELVTQKRQKESVEQENKKEQEYIRKKVIDNAIKNGRAKVNEDGSVSIPKDMFGDGQGEESGNGFENNAELDKLVSSGIVDGGKLLESVRITANDKKLDMEVVLRSYINEISDSNDKIKKVIEKNGESIYKYIENEEHGNKVGGHVPEKKFDECVNSLKDIVQVFEEVEERFEDEGLDKSFIPDIDFYKKCKRILLKAQKEKRGYELNNYLLGASGV